MSRNHQSRITHKVRHLVIAGSAAAAVAGGTGAGVPSCDSLTHGWAPTGSHVSADGSASFSISNPGG